MIEKSHSPSEFSSLKYGCSISIFSWNLLEFEKFHQISTIDSHLLNLEWTCLNRSFAVFNRRNWGTEHLKHNAPVATTKCWVCVYLYPDNGNLWFPGMSTSNLCIIPGLLHMWRKMAASWYPAGVFPEPCPSLGAPDPLYPSESNPRIQPPLSVLLTWALWPSPWSAHFSPGQSLPLIQTPPPSLSRATSTAVNK